MRSLKSDIGIFWKEQCKDWRPIFAKRNNNSSSIDPTIKKNRNINMVYSCLNCTYYTHGDIGDLLNHISGKHCVEVKAGNIHFAHCNSCPRTNGHGRRLSSFEIVRDHLWNQHGIEISEDWYIYSCKEIAKYRFIDSFEYGEKKISETSLLISLLIFL